MTMEQAYAQALWKMIEAGRPPQSAVKSVHGALEARGRLGLLPRISRAFSRIANRAIARDNVVIYVAREKDAKHVLKEAAPIFAETGIEAKNVEIRIDENCIGGWRLEGKEALYDNSYKKHLLSVYNRVTKA